MKKKIFAAIALSLAFNCTVFAASFDCAKAVSRIENAICASPELSNLDSQLATAYAAALARSSDVDGVKAAQRAWLKETRNSCGDLNCLTAVYKQRIAALSVGVNDSPLAQELPSTSVRSSSDVGAANAILTRVPSSDPNEQLAAESIVDEQAKRQAEEAAIAELEKKQAEEVAAAELVRRQAQVAAAELARKQAQEAATAALAKKQAEEVVAIAQAKKQADSAAFRDLLIRWVKAAGKALFILLVAAVIYKYRAYLLKTLKSLNYTTLFSKSEKSTLVLRMPHDEIPSAKELSNSVNNKIIDESETRFGNVPVEIGFYILIVFGFLAIDFDALRLKTSDFVAINFAAIILTMIGITIGAIIHGFGFKISGLGVINPSHKIRRKISVVACIIFGFLFLVFFQVWNLTFAATALTAASFFLLINPYAASGVFLGVIIVFYISIPVVFYGALVIGTKIFMKKIAWASAIKAGALYGVFLIFLFVAPILVRPFL